MNDFEIVVVDDGSAPENRRRLEKHLHDWGAELSNGAVTETPTLTLIYQENRGAYRARFAGVANSNSRYIKFLDHDDRLVPGALAKEIAFADEVQADVVMTDWFQGTNGGIGRSPTRTAGHRAPEYTDPLTDFLEIGGVYTGAALYRRELFSGITPIASWEPRLKDDWAVFAQICLQHPDKGFYTLHQPSYVWIHHDAQQTASAGSGRSIAEAYQFLSWFDDALQEHDQYNPRRRCAMARYYMKNALLLCEQHPLEWRRIARRISELCPSAGKSLRANSVAKLSVALFGTESGVSNYVCAKRLLGRA